jgi:hypothetical protein
MGNFVLGLHEDALVQGDANSVENVGFLPSAHIQLGICTNPGVAASFQAFNEPHMFPVKYDPVEDELLFNPDHLWCVQLTPEALGGQAGVNHHVFALDRNTAAAFYDYDVWSSRFDSNGITGKKAVHTLVPLPNVEVITAPGANPGPQDPTYNAWVAHTVAYANYVEQALEIAERLTEINEAERWFGLKTGADFPDDDETYTWDDGVLDEFYQIPLWTQQGRWQSQVISPPSQPKLLCTVAYLGIPRETHTIGAQTPPQAGCFHGI